MGNLIEILNQAAEMFGMERATFLIAVTFLLLVLAFQWKPFAETVRRLTNTPSVAMLKTALMPHIEAAIMKGYQGSEALIDASQQRLNGLDKAKLARRVITDFLGGEVKEGGAIEGLGAELFLKLISEQQIEEWIQEAFNELNSRIDLTQEQIGEIVETI